MMSYINETDFVIENKKLVYPEIVTEGLQLYYDAKGKRDTDYHRDTMLDMSGNKNHGKLHNFAYEKHSGYKDGLVFDYIDDKLVRPSLNLQPDDFTFMLNGNIISFSPDGTVKRVQDGEVIETKGTNMVRNGDFSNGRTGWSTANLTYSKVLTKNRFTLNTTAYSEAVQSMNFTLGNKYYVRMNGLAYSLQVNALFRISLHSTGGTPTKVIQTINRPSVISEVVTSATIGTNQRLLVSVSSGSQNDYFEFDNIMFIDLTATFGAGNEPTKEQMDEIINRFGFIPNAQDLIDSTEYKGNALGDMENIIDGLYKTEVLSGTEIYTDKADADAVVHVEVDGKSEHRVLFDRNEMNINIDSTKIDSDLIDYPVRVKLSSENIDFSKVRSDGLDIRFCNMDNSLLDFEIESFSYSNQTGVYHVRIPLVSSTVDTKFKIVYGDDNSNDLSNPVGVWDDNFVMVHHMGESLADSTGNGNNATNYGTTTVVDNGKVVRQFTTDSYMDFPVVNQSNLTLQIMLKTSDNQWLPFSTLSASDYIMANTASAVFYHSNAGNNITSYVNGNVATRGFYDNTWQILTATNVDLTTWSSLGVNKYTSGGVWDLNGLYTEFRISSITRSDSWIKADDYNLRTNTLLSIGREIDTTMPSPDYPIEIHSLNDFDVVSSVGKENLSIDKNRWGSVQSILEIKDSVIRGTTNTSAKPSWPRIYNTSVANMVFDTNSEYTLSLDIRASKAKTVSSGISELGSREAITAFSLSSVGTEWKRLERTFIPMRSISENYAPSTYLWFYTGGTTGESSGDWIELRNVKLEKNKEATPYSKSPYEVTEDGDYSTIDKINLSLSEPLRSVGDVKDRLFRDSDGLWKVERNVGDMLLKDLSISTTAPFGGSNSYHFGGSVAFIVDSGNKLGRHTYSGFKSSFLRDVGDNNNYNNTTDAHTKLVGTVARINGENHRVFIRVSESTIGAVEGDNTSTLVSKFGGWVTENNVSLQYQLANPTIETLPQSYQDKLNNIATYAGSNYLYTVVDKTNILPNYVRDNLKPNLNAKFLYNNWYKEDRVINNLMIYNRALTNEEMLQNYKTIKRRWGM